jgi:N4-gp56 family major capsid protein
MAATSNTTKLEDLINPQVMADLIEKKLIDRIRFAPLATIDNTLVGRDGDEITYPFYGYIGASEDVNEGADIPIRKLEQGTKKVKVGKIGIGVQYTDEALLSGLNNDIGAEIANQIVTSISDTIDR